MKILQISPSPPDYLGGLAHYTKFLSKYLGENNLQVDLLCSSLTKKGTKYEKFSKNFRVIKKKCYAFADNDNALRIKNPIFNVLTYLLRYGKKYDIIHVHSYIYFSTIQTFFYKLFFGRKIPLILHLHGILEGHVAQTTNKIEKVLFLFKKYFYDLTIGKLMFKKADAVFSVSKEDLIISHNVFKVNLKGRVKAFYIPNAIDPEKFKKLSNIKRRFIGYINRLSTYSGIDLFLELIKRYNKIDEKQEFLIIGKGPYLPEVKKALGNYPIVFHEMVPHDEMVNFYNMCSVIVVITRSEGLSTVLLEALSCEVPGIASDVGGNPELIKDGITGYLFEKANVDQAIKKLIDVKKNNEYEKLGRNGRKLVEDHYSWKKIVKQTISVYNKLKKP
ncbi:MAG: glycosyltransferase family 4 protein [Promethearchaeota archaeon]